MEADVFVIGCGPAGLQAAIHASRKKASVAVTNEMMDKARKIATERMIAEAERLGADAIVCVRFATSSIMQSAAEIMIYGTAVKFR